MKIFLMADMEGSAGILNHDDWVVKNGYLYEKGKRIVTNELNAAIDGFFAGGATEVLVCDGHGYGGIDVELLDERAMIQRGFIGPYPFGLDESFDAIAWVGQHPKAATKKGHMCHTGYFNVIDYRINDISVGEFGQMSFCAIELGVTPIFGSGCKAFCEEAEALIPGIQTATVKYGLVDSDGHGLNTDQYMRHTLAAVHLSPKSACKLIRENAEKAVLRFKNDPASFKLPKLTAPYTVDIDYRDMGERKAYSVHKEHPTSVISCLNSR